jgi:hypothetical protein
MVLPKGPQVYVIDDSDSEDNDGKLSSKEAAASSSLSDDERKPAAKNTAAKNTDTAATATSQQKIIPPAVQQKQSTCISLLDDDDSSVEDVTTNTSTTAAAASHKNSSRKRSHDSENVINVDSDRILAERIAKKEEKKMKNNIAKANPLREQRLMAQSTDGKAVLAVQEVFALVDSTRKHAKKKNESHLVNYIAAVTREDMFHFAKAMLELQQDFLQKNINGYIDVGYHYTSNKYLKNIRHHGLLTRKDRDSQKVQSASHGSVFGDGIYTANNPTNFSNYGNTGLLVARLTGEMVRVARSLHPSMAVDATTNTIIGDKMINATGRQSLDKDNWPLSDAHHEIVLRSSAQCLPVISFDSRTRQSNEGNKCIDAMEKGLQEIFDKLFNRGIKRSAYQEAKILKATLPSSSYPLPPINPTFNPLSGLTQFNPLNGSAQVFNPFLPPLAGVGPATSGIASAPLPTTRPMPAAYASGPTTRSRSSLQQASGPTTRSRSSLQQARQRMRGNTTPVPSSTTTSMVTHRQRMRGNTMPVPSSTTAAVNHISSNPLSNTLTYTAPATLTTGIPSDAMSTPDSSCNMDDDCVICQDPLGKRRKCAVLKCQHVFHKDCIQRAFQSKPQCPVCRKSIGAPIGKSPSGTMRTASSSTRCAGYSENSIVITYSIPAGRQMSYHDAPGTSHAGKLVTAYVPK